MYEFNWYDPDMIVNNRADRILPGIQVGCVRYGAWGMHRGMMGRMGILRSNMGRRRGEQDMTIEIERDMCVCV